MTSIFSVSFPYPSTLGHTGPEDGGSRQQENMTLPLWPDAGRSAGSVASAPQVTPVCPTAVAEGRRIGLLLIFTFMQSQNRLKEPPSAELGARNNVTVINLT